MHLDRLDRFLERGGNRCRQVLCLVILAKILPNVKHGQHEMHPTNIKAEKGQRVCETEALAVILDLDVASCAGKAVQQNE